MPLDIDSNFSVEAHTFRAGFFPDPILAPTGQSPLKFTAKRYSPKAMPLANDTEGLTLVFCHSAGAHKEQWEPVIKKLFTEQKASKSGSPHIREAWSLEWMSHGDAAILNAKVLQTREWNDIVVSTSEWGAAIAHFIRTHNLHKKKTIAIGHSAGSAALCHSTAFFPPHEPPYKAFILVETTLLPVIPYLQNKENRDQVLQVLKSGILGRRDSWENTEQAYNWLEKRFPWSMWDKRAVKLYAEHGMHRLPDGHVRIKCDKEHEASSYSDFEGHLTAIPLLKRIVSQVSTFFVYGEQYDLVPQNIRDPLLESVRLTKDSPSVLYVPDAGHLVVQQNPDGLALSIMHILQKLDYDALKSRL